MSKYQVTAYIHNIPEDDYEATLEKIENYIIWLGLEVEIGIGVEDE